MTETIVEILKKVGQHRPCSKGSLYNYLHALKIKPIGARQAPQRYPAGTATAVINYLGLSGGNLPTVEQLKSNRRMERRAA